MSTLPYPGLRPFRADEVDIFFGREEHVDQLLEKLGSNRFLGVVGPSGCGKSSLVGAGMIPALETGYLASAGARWRVATMRPGDRPLQGLAEALLADTALGPERAGSPLAAGLLLAGLRRGPLGLVEALEETPMPERTNLLLVVDQFEEIFRYHQHGDSDEADAFVALLLATVQARDLPIYVVLTMRSDFLGDCALFQGLPEALNDSQFLTPRLGREQRRACIVGPAGVFRGKCEPALVNRLLNDMGDEPDQLPLMQHVLMRMWTEAQDSGTKTRLGVHSALTVKGYEAVGGFSNALSRHADEAFDELDDQQKIVAERMFRCLSERGSGERDTRRPAKLGEVAAAVGSNVEQVAAVAEVFRRPDRSFLTPPAEVPLDEQSVLDISHESLLRQWRRLRRWVDDEARSAETYSRLLETARLWKDGKAGLWGPPDLDLALAWKHGEAPTESWAARYGGDFDLTMEFLAAGEQKQADDHLAQEQARDERERQKRITQISIALGLGMLIAVSLAVVAFREWREARKHGRSAEAGQLMAQATAIRDRVPEHSLLFAVEALQTVPADNVEGVAAAGEVLLLSLQKTGGRPLVGHSDRVGALAVSPDGRLLASGSSDRTAQLWSLEDPAAEPIVLRGHGDTVSALGFTPDGRRLLTGSDDRTVRIWDMPEPGEPIVLEGHTDSITSLAIRADGRYLLTGSEDQTARWWSLDQPQADSVLLAGAEGVIWDVAISPDGRHLAAAGDDNTALLWTVDRLSDGPRVLRGHEGAVHAVSFSPDGRRLATGSDDNSARLWEIAPEGEIRSTVLRQHESSVRRITFTPDGRYLITGSHDDTARLWPLDGDVPTSTALVGHRSVVSSLAVSPDGWLVTGSWDKTARIWNLDSPDLGSSSIALYGHGESINALAISSDSRWLATAGSDHVIRLWPLTQADHDSSSVTLEGFRDAISSVAYSPDGRWLATGSEDNTIRLWQLGLANLATQPILLQGHHSSVNAVTVGPKSKWLASGSDDNTARLWDLSRDPETSIVLEGHRSSVSAVAIDPAGRLLATASLDATARLWSLSDPGAGSMVLEGHQDSLTAVLFSPDGRWLATASEDGDTRLWALSDPFDVTSPAPEAIVLPGHQDSVAALTFSADSRLLVTGSEDSDVLLWPVTADGSGHKHRILRGHRGPVTTLALSANGERLITGSEDNTARVWDLTLEDPSADAIVLRGHTADVTRVAITADGNYPITAGADAMAQLWDLTVHPPQGIANLVGHEGPITALALGPQQRSLVTGSVDKTARLWHYRSLWTLPLKSLIDSACQIAGRNLSPAEWQHYLAGSEYREICPGLPTPEH